MLNILKREEIMVLKFVNTLICEYLCNTINQSYKYINLNSKSNGNKREFLEK